MLPLLSGAAIERTGKPFDRPDIMVPHVGGRRYGWTHYGVMIPDLPEPHRYFSIMVIAGLPGATALDNDDAVVRSPRDTVTMSASTAAPGVAHFGAYSMSEQCVLTPDGSLLDFGGDVVVTGTYPDFHVRVGAGEFTADLQLRCTGEVAWFARSVVYDHLSLLVEYTGSISVAGRRSEVSGLGTYEYAACAGLHGLVDRPLSASTKVPLDFFSYHVIGVDERSQLLLADTHVLGAPLATMAYFRSLDDDTWVTHEGVRFEVTEYAAEPATDPFGQKMRLPTRFTWTAADVLVVHGIVDSPPRYGVGRGYIIGYSCEGNYRGRPFDARGYMEYIDREAVDRADPEFRTATADPLLA
ncbi:DUF6670 family protein [Nocardia sp. CA-128927]|uniref:DUF6670 family protein n=1 Tax=Nocardia sp. CA-128927 TaxID=3239975 RepID=UPI003D98FC3A